jgi:hypothetical protein
LRTLITANRFISAFEITTSESYQIPTTMEEKRTNEWVAEKELEVRLIDGSALRTNEWVAEKELEVRLIDGSAFLLEGMLFEGVWTVIKEGVTVRNLTAKFTIQIRAPGDKSQP